MNQKQIYSTSIYQTTENVVEMKKKVEMFLNDNENIKFVGAYKGSGARLYLTFEAPRGTDWGVWLRLGSDSIFVNVYDLKLLRKRPKTPYVYSSNITKFFSGNTDEIPIWSKTNIDGFTIEKELW